MNYFSINTSFTNVLKMSVFFIIMMCFVLAQSKAAIPCLDSISDFDDSEEKVGIAEVANMTVPSIGAGQFASDRISTVPVDQSYGNIQGGAKASLLMDHDYWEIYNGKSGNSDTAGAGPMNTMLTDARKQYDFANNSALLAGHGQNHNWGGNALVGPSNTPTQQSLANFIPLTKDANDNMSNFGENLTKNLMDRINQVYYPDGNDFKKNWAAKSADGERWYKPGILYITEASKQSISKFEENMAGDDVLVELGPNGSDGPKDFLDFFPAKIRTKVQIVLVEYKLNVKYDDLDLQTKFSSQWTKTDRAIAMDNENNVASEVLGRLLSGSPALTAYKPTTFEGKVNARTKNQVRVNIDRQTGTFIFDYLNTNVSNANHVSWQW